MAEVAPRADDQTVAEIAVREGRVLLTEDKDFGRLVYAEGLRTAGVSLIRYPATARVSLPQAIVALVTQRTADIPGRFIVVQPGRIRIGPPHGE